MQAVAAAGKAAQAQPTFRQPRSELYILRAFRQSLRADALHFSPVGLLQLRFVDALRERRIIFTTRFADAVISSFVAQVIARGLLIRNWRRQLFPTNRVRDCCCAHANCSWSLVFAELLNRGHKAAGHKSESQAEIKGLSCPELSRRCS